MIITVAYCSFWNNQSHRMSWGKITLHYAWWSKNIATMTLLIFKSIPWPVIMREDLCFHISNYLYLYLQFYLQPTQRKLFGPDNPAYDILWLTTWKLFLTIIMKEAFNILLGHLAPRLSLIAHFLSLWSPEIVLIGFPSILIKCITIY